MSMSLSMRGMSMSPKSSSAVVGGGGPVAPGPFTLPLLAGLGASRVRQSGIGISNGGYEIAGGMMTWMKALDRRIKYTAWYDATATQNSSNLNGMIFANDGNTFVNMLARIPKLCASDANIVMYDLASNSLQFTSTIANFTDVAKSELALLLAAGKLPLVLSLVERITSTGGVWSSGGAIRALVPGINTEMQSYCTANGIPYADIRSVLVDLATADHEPLAGQTRDGTHWSPRGAYDAAVVALAALSSSINASAAATMSTGAELLTNPTFTGTGGLVTGTNILGLMPTSWNITRKGSTTNAAMVVSIVGGAIRVQIDTTAMGASDREGFRLDTAALILVATNWYTGKIDFDAKAWDGWLSFAIPRISDGTREATGMEGINSGATPLTDPAVGTPLPFPTPEVVATAETFAIQSGGTSGTYFVNVMFGKGTSGGGDIYMSAPSCKQITDPLALLYNDADVTPIAITSANAFSFAENTAISQQLTTNKTYCKWALSGTDAAKFTIDNFGVLSGAALDFEIPTDVGGDNVYNITATATDFNPANGSSAQNIAITVTDVADGTVYTFTGTDGTDLQDWNAGIVRDGTTGAITINTNRAKNLLSIARTAYTFPQEGNSVDQEVRWDVPNGASPAAIPCPIMQDVGNYIGITFASGVIEVTTRVGAGTPNHGTTFPPYKTIASSDKFIAQRLGNNVNVYQNGVYIGGRDVTGILTGVKTAGLVSNTATGSSNSIDNLNIRPAVALTPLVGLYPITFSPLTGAAGVDVLATATGKTTNSDMNVTGYTGGVAGVVWTADGVNLRASAPPAGTYVVSGTEGFPGAVNDGRVWTATFVIS